MNAPFVPVVHGAVPDRPDEIDTIETAGEIAQVLASRGFATEIVALERDLGALDALAARQPAAVFNLVESLAGSADLAFAAFAAMDRLGLAYTGTRTGAYVRSLSKLTTKKRLGECGLATAMWWEDGGDVPAGCRVIIKAVSEHASLGMDQDSVVDGRDAAREMAGRAARFGCRFFAEEYLPGREFNVAVLERGGTPLVLPIQEIAFSSPPGRRHAIVDYDAKWLPESAGYEATPRRFGLDAREPALAMQLRDVGQACWDAFDLQGYARVDIRLDAEGAPRVLEVNANPCLARDAGFAATAAEAGIAYEDLIMCILASAVPALAVAA